MKTIVQRSMLFSRVFEERHEDVFEKILAAFLSTWRLRCPKQLKEASGWNVFYLSSVFPLCLMIILSICLSLTNMSSPISYFEKHYTSEDQKLMCEQYSFWMICSTLSDVVYTTSTTVTFVEESVRVSISCGQVDGLCVTNFSSSMDEIQTCFVRCAQFYCSWTMVMIMRLDTSASIITFHHFHIHRQHHQRIHCHRKQTCCHRDIHHHQRRTNRPKKGEAAWWRFQSLAKRSVAWTEFPPKRSQLWKLFFHAIRDHLIYQRSHAPDVGKFREMAVNDLTRNPLAPAGVHFGEFLQHNANWKEYLTTMKEDGTWADNTMVHGMVDALKSTISIVTSEEWHNIHHANMTYHQGTFVGILYWSEMWLTPIFWSLQRKYMLNISIALDEALFFSHRISVFEVHCSEVHGS